MEQLGNIIISCVICTFQRPRRLEVAIQSLLAQSLESKYFEIIIVDNNSQDETPLVVDNFQKNSQINIMYVFEKKQGLSNARNVGIQHARGVFVAFLDDDAEADTHWLDSLVRVLDDDPDLWVVGGKILPIWDGKRPSWLEDDFLNNFSILDLGNRQKDLSWPEHVVGTNICFRKRAFSKTGTFQISLGRSGKSLVGDEDTEIQRRIHSFGKRVVYSPDAIVWHHIAVDRISKQYIYKRAFGTGRARAFVYSRQSKLLACLWQLVRAFAGMVFYGIVWLFPLLNPVSRIKVMRSIYTKAGYLLQMANFLIFRKRGGG